MNETASPPDHDHAIKQGNRIIIARARADAASKRALSIDKESLYLPKKSHRGGVHEIPKDIVFEIAKYLSPVGLMCLSYVCRFLRGFFGCSAKEVLDSEYDLSATASMPRPSIHGPTNSKSREDRLQLLRLLNQDNLWGPWTIVCKECVAVHRGSKFPPPNSDDSGIPKDVCLASTQRVYVCPHSVFSHKELQKLNEKGPIAARRTESGWECKACGIPVYISYDGISQVRYPLRDLTIRLNSSKAFVPDAIPPKTMVEEDLLQRHPFLLCPHIFLHDSDNSRKSDDVISVYSQDCKRLQAAARGSGLWNCFCKVCLKGDLQCDKCDTKIRWDVSERDRGRKRLQLIVTRNLMTVGEVGDPAWAAQVYPLHLGVAYLMWPRLDGVGCDQ